jgi:spermidine synthase
MNNINVLSGHQFMAEWFDCSGEMFDSSILQKTCIHYVERCGLLPVNSIFHSFGIDLGVTGVVLLGESHCAIHTWPEKKSVTIDIYVCNSKSDNFSKAEALFFSLKNFFKPRQAQEHYVSRGTDIAPRHIHGFEGYHIDIEAKSVLASGDTFFQSYEIIDTVRFGVALKLDGAIMTTERDEHLYHEPMAHIPLLAQKDPKKALIIGGGDGGLAHHLLKHKSLESVKIVEIDKGVVTISKQWLKNIHRGSYSDPRVSLVYQDGLAFSKNALSNGDPFDSIMLDLTDAFIGKSDGLADPLHSDTSYKIFSDLLNKDGVLSIHAGGDFFQDDEINLKQVALSKIFQFVVKRKVFIPTFGCEWVFIFSTNSKETYLNLSLNTSQLSEIADTNGIQNRQWLVSSII